MTRQRDTMIRRFSLTDIAQHLLLVATFLLLTATGLPQKYYDSELSQWMINNLGGVHFMRNLHHMAAIAFTALVAGHLIISSSGIIFRQRQFHMLITINDFIDALHNFKYYLGVAPEPASCDKFDYKEKFIYWFVLTGAVVMIATGFVLWFPVIMANYLPGQLIPVSKTMHSNEALLIFLLLAIWHIYDSIFSPNVFPLDTSIFSGYIARERMRREHLLELMRLEGATEGEISEFRRRSMRDSGEG